MASPVACSYSYLCRYLKDIVSLEEIQYTGVALAFD